MRDSIAAVSLSGTLIETAEAVATAGFDGVEIFESDVLQWSRGARCCGRASP